MIKSAIAPIQNWLLGQGMCVGCGMPLSKAKSQKHKNGAEKITCSCRRVYIKDVSKKSYRRALPSEI
jgi:hypothetical protein